MTYDYFIESGNRASYLAFDAPKHEVARIQAILNRSDMLPINGEIRESVRPAANGKCYKYYTRVKNLAHIGFIDSIFGKKDCLVEKPIKIDNSNQQISKLEARIAELEKTRNIMGESLRRLEMKSALMSLSVSIRNINPTTPMEGHVLRPEMIDALISSKPINKTDFAKLIPWELRHGCNSIEARDYLDAILDVINRIENCD